MNFDRNFLHFSPEISLITSVDYDHPDTYPTKDSYLDAFREFGEKSKKVIAWQENSAIFDEKNLTILYDSNKKHHSARRAQPKECYFGDRSFEIYGSGRGGVRNIPSNKLLPRIRTTF